METEEIEKGSGSEIGFRRQAITVNSLADLKAFSLVNNDTTVVVKLILLSTPAAKVSAHCLLDTWKQLNAIINVPVY